MKIINIRTGGLALYGALIVGVIVATVFSRQRKINVLNFLDFCIPYFVLAQAIGRWGNFTNQEAFGRNTNLPWGMTGNDITEYLKKLGTAVDPNIPVHPTFLYESLWNLGVFLLLIWFSKKKKLNGEVFCLYLIAYGAGRFWIEGLRLDSLLMGTVRVSQLLSLVLVIVFGLIFAIRRVKLKGKLDSVNAVESEYSGLVNALKEKTRSENVETIVSEEATVKISETVENKGEEGI